MKKSIKNSLAFFIFVKYLHYRNYNEFYSGSDKNINELFNKGIVVIPDFLTKNQCKNILNDYSDHFNKLQNGTYNRTKFHNYKEYGVTRILEAQTLSHESLLFFNNDYIINIAQMYVSKNVSSYQKMIELRSGDNTKSKADGIHFDDWKQRFKAFLYLNNVTSDNAPFRYYPASHLGKGWRLRRLLAEHNYFLHGKSGKYGYFSRDEFSKHKLTFPELVCCGSAGTLILVDTRGLHSGTPLVSGQRMMLASYFDVR